MVAGAHADPVLIEHRGEVVGMNVVDDERDHTTPSLG
jgi:hypothetical protein